MNKDKLINSNLRCITDSILEFHKDSYYSKDEGVSYPIISGIPILKNDLAILSTFKDKVQNEY